MYRTAGFQVPLDLLIRELDQKEYEGYPVPSTLREQIKGLDHDAHAYDFDIIENFHAELDRLERDPEFDYVQPNDFNSIKEACPQRKYDLAMTLSDDELLDRFHGAWTGRSCGCALGKPVEALGMSKNGRARIKQYLVNRHHWPLDYYFSNEKVDDVRIGCPSSCRERIAYMEPDDDIHYTLTNMKVLESRGPDFKWYDIADCWNSSIPYNSVCSAEMQAILNYNMLHARRTLHRTTPEFTRSNNNPYREWIGAQIRADFWGYSCAGNPELAAEFAWRDAHWTHSANGIYGEMFFAAVIAAAFVESDPGKLVEVGLAHIPERCKLAEAIRQALDWIDENPTFEDFMDQLDETYGNMCAVHTVNNALVCIMALFYGNMNPDKSICMSVMAALDTDCNGATVGSIVGAASGRKEFGGKLADPLNDTIKPLVVGFQEVTMTELAERTIGVYKSVSSETLENMDLCQDR